MAIRPTGVGVIIKRHLKKECITILDASKAAGISRVLLSNIVNNNKRLSLDIAAKIERSLGIDVALLLRAQCEYDIWKIRTRNEEGSGF